MLGDQFMEEFLFIHYFCEVLLTVFSITKNMPMGMLQELHASGTLARKHRSKRVSQYHRYRNSACPCYSLQEVQTAIPKFFRIITKHPSYLRTIFSTMMLPLKN